MIFPLDRNVIFVLPTFYSLPLGVLVMTMVRMGVKAGLAVGFIVSSVDRRSGACRQAFTGLLPRGWYQHQGSFTAEDRRHGGLTETHGNDHPARVSAAKRIFPGL
jgi:hypothetical protein